MTKEQRKQAINKELQECGYDRIVKAVSRDVAKHLSASQLKVYMFLTSQTFGYNRNTVECSYKKIAAGAGVKRRAAIYAVAELERLGLISKERKGGSANIFKVEKVKGVEKLKNIKDVKQNNACKTGVVKIGNFERLVLEKIAESKKVSKMEALRICLMSSKVFLSFMD